MAPGPSHWQATRALAAAFTASVGAGRGLSLRARARIYKRLHVTIITFHDAGGARRRRAAAGPAPAAAGRRLRDPDVTVTRDS